MKKINNLKYLLSFAVIFGLASCQKGFEKLNQNEYNATNLDPGFLLTNVERNLSTGGYDNGEQTIIQQVINGLATGTPGFNVNNDNNVYNRTRWDQCYGRVKDLVQIISILKAYNFMVLVDTYGDVPYSEAGLGYLENKLYPKYDKQADIYADLYKELKEASAALSTTGDAVPQDFIYGIGRTTTAAAQIPKWKRLGYSLLLRLGMRYSKSDAAKAQSIVAEAYNGGVMTSIADNFIVGFNAIDVNPLNTALRTNNPYFYYIAAPFADQLRTTKDPRSKYMIATYANAGVITVAPSDTTAAGQFGLPVGVGFGFNSSHPAWRGASGSGYKLSQLNFNTYNSGQAPIFFATYAQTQLLLAEAAFRNWLPAGASTTAVYYAAGIRASMDQLATFPNAAPIPAADFNSYIAQPSVALTAGTELAKINTQYWIESLNNGAEGYANWRRTGFPTLSPNTAGTPPTSGFVRRFPYPDAEFSANPANYQEAVARMGGDDLNQRVFWDIP
jgi:hypothetical protein